MQRRVHLHPCRRDINGRACRVTHQQQRNQPGASSRAADYGSGRAVGSRGDYGGGRGGGGRGGRGGRRDEPQGGSDMMAAAAGGMLGAGMLPGMMVPGMMPAGMMGELELPLLLGVVDCPLHGLVLSQLQRSTGYCECCSAMAAVAWCSAAAAAVDPTAAAPVSLHRACHSQALCTTCPPTQCRSGADLSCADLSCAAPCAGMAMPGMDMMQGMMMMPGMQGMVPFGMPGAAGSYTGSSTAWRIVAATAGLHRVPLRVGHTDSPMLSPACLLS